MKKKILISQRLDKVGIFNELRDNLDVRLVQLVEDLKLIPILVPNKLNNINQYIKILKPNGIILTGGGNPKEKNERKKIELSLIRFAIKENLPLLGICRGAQSINLYFKGKLSKIKSHVRKKHIISGTLSNKKVKFKVNSYHNYGIKDVNLANQLKILFQAEDNSVEAFTTKNKKIMGIMWHPERQKKIQKIEYKLLQNFFKCS